MTNVVTSTANSLCNLVIIALFTEQEQERDCIEKLIESNLVQASC